MQLSLRITFPRPNRRNHLRSIVVALAACTALGTTPARAGSWVTCPQGESRTNCENRQGSVDTSHWKLDYFADKNHIIEGYASKTSVNYKNDTIAFYVNAPNASRYDLEIFRMGWYGGLGARRVYQRLNQIPTTQSPCTLPNPPAPLQCNWQAIVPEISLATDFSSPVDGPVSGYYLVKLSSHYPDNAIAQSYIIFVVREDLVPRTLLMNAAVTTYQAYNCWGPPGQQRSLYNCGDQPAATQVSFNRPYDTGLGTGLFFEPNPLGYDVTSIYPSSWPWAGFEYPMVRFLERGLLDNAQHYVSYDVKYATDIDLHADSAQTLLNGVSGFLSVGHDEYWSKQMHDNLEIARDRNPPTNIAFFSGNSVFWIINVLPSRPNAGDYRIIETHKAPHFPYPQTPEWLWQNCPYIPGDATDAPICSLAEGSEQMLVGSITTDGTFDRGDFVFRAEDFGSQVPPWLFNGTNLTAGSRLPGMIGYEAQTVKSNPAPNAQNILAHSQFKSHPFVPNVDPAYPFADMSLYTLASGASVFSSGSTDWSFGLDIFSTDFPSTNYNRIHPVVGQITRNVLHQFGDGRSPGGFTLPAYSLVPSLQGQVCIDYTRPGGRPPSIPGQSDYIALFMESRDDDVAVSYTSGDCNNLTGVGGRCCIPTPNTPGYYTADYVTLDKHWQLAEAPQVLPQMRTIWRAAKSSRITVQ